MNWLNIQLCDAYELIMKMGEEFPALHTMLLIDSLTKMVG
ncbi:hypothetical protein PP425_gp081 [Enterobacter phage vB_EclM_Q7622]|nr:hypothetical protein PP425_gp081 [Enterobacter phage vB_EclM_Q7622]UIS65596.1 hypothetical protein Q76222_00081 [Enterobacter phage vB_EclM_Q7622]